MKINCITRDARGGSSEQTAIGFVECPDELIVWLVEHYARGTPLPAGDLQEAQSLARTLRSGSGDDEQGEL